jgi:hypothetical protein
LTDWVSFPVANPHILRHVYKIEKRADDYSTMHEQKYISIEGLLSTTVFHTCSRALKTLNPKINE